MTLIIWDAHGLNATPADPHWCACGVCGAGWYVTTVPGTNAHQCPKCGAMTVRYAWYATLTSTDVQLPDVTQRDKGA